MLDENIFILEKDYFFIIGYVNPDTNSSPLIPLALAFITTSWKYSSLFGA
jgi:hypothetical protein